MIDQKATGLHAGGQEIAPEAVIGWVPPLPYSSVLFVYTGNRRHREDRRIDERILKIEEGKLICTNRSSLLIQ